MLLYSFCYKQWLSNKTLHLCFYGMHVLQCSISSVCRGAVKHRQEPSEFTKQAEAQLNKCIKSTLREYP